MTTTWALDELVDPAPDEETERFVQKGKGVDLWSADEMRRLGQPKCHDRHETLSAGQHAPVARRELPEKRDRFLHGRRRVANERCWFHG